MKFISCFFALSLIILQSSFASEVEFRVNQVLTKKGEVYSDYTIKDFTLGINQEGKLDVEKLETNDGRILTRADLEYAIIVGSTPLDQIEDRDEQNDVLNRSAFMTRHAGFLEIIRCP